MTTYDFFDDTTTCKTTMTKTCEKTTLKPPPTQLEIHKVLVLIQAKKDKFLERLDVIDLKNQFESTNCK
jgi:hypothetical protein